jgi:type VI secretion system secreted protein VgrG
MPAKKTHEKSQVWMKGSYKDDDLLLKRAIVREKFSTLTEATVEFKSTNKAVKIEEILGQTITVVIETAGKNERCFSGICVAVENLGFRDGFGQYIAQVRPWFWLMTQASNCRIFQDMKAVDIIKQIFGDHGFSEFTDKLTEPREVREYCVQYRETDFAFISRLMEEEGIYYYFDNGTSAGPLEKLILCDGLRAHAAMPEGARQEFYARHQGNTRKTDYVAEWSAEETVNSGKVTLTDYDFLTPPKDLEVRRVIKKGKKYNTLEAYDYPGHYRKETGLGETQARVRMESKAIQHKRWRGATNLRTLSTGYSFKLADHPDVSETDEFLVTDAVHYIQNSADFEDSKRRRDLQYQDAEIPESMARDIYACTFGAIPLQEQFRAPLRTPWPEISGLHTAIVVGPKGEEIWTDKYGRIKVQFHWDRDGKMDENASCWVRVVTPWAGKNWGMVAIPRIGQEVVIQFEEGNPDRPICTGMLYNEDNKPAYDFPSAATQSGLRTDSSKGVKDSKAYNEVMFEDKGGKELMRIQAQKNQQVLVKDRAVVTIGLDKPVPEMSAAEEKSLTQTVKMHVLETIKEGDHTFKIETGSQKIEIKTDKTQTIKGKHTKTITGNDATTVTSGNMTVDVSSGKITMSAAVEILLKVGGSSVKIDNSGVTIKGPLIKIEAGAMAEMKSPVTTVKGDAVLTLKGGITMIN